VGIYSAEEGKGANRDRAGAPVVVEVVVVVVVVVDGRFCAGSMYECMYVCFMNVWMYVCFMNVCMYGCMYVL